uniref:autotransporter outer membrane beta-barrel domain-containing protein n=1 Tax=uncultured Phenylobacterium sp. TaxID=349273 RepID=UPI0026011743
GSMFARAYGAQATGVLLNLNAIVPAFRNAGSVGAETNGGLHDARAIVDLSGRLALVENSGSIVAQVNPVTGVAQTGRAVAIDLSANGTGAVVRQAKVNTADAPKITGDVLLGAGNDRLELLAGSLVGTMSFGAGADTLVLDGGATAAGRIVDADGQLALDVRNGLLSLANTEAVSVSSLNVGSKGVLAVSIDPAVTATRLNVSGAATVATGAQVAVTLTGLSRVAKSFQVVQAGSLTVGGAGAALAGAPFLYQANLRADLAAGALFVDLRPKTTSELGLNRSGSQAYGAVFEALDKDEAIEAAFLSQTTRAGFQDLYDQMLPDHSGGTLMSAAALSAAVSQAAAEPLTIDGDASTGLWAQEVVFDLRQDRTNAMGFKSRGFGFAAGMDLQGETTAVGANVSFVTTDIKDRGGAADEQVSMNLVGTGLYWRLDGGPLQAAVRGGIGYAFLKGDRRLLSDAVNLRAKADWNAWMADAYAGVSYAWQAGAFYARPELSASYTRLAEDGYREEGGGPGFDLIVDKRTGDLLTGQALVALGWRFGDAVWWAPEVKAGYRAKLAGKPGATTAHFDGGADFTLDPENVFKGGAILRAGFRGGVARALYSVNAGGTFDGDYQEYDVRAALRIQF